MKEEEFIIFIGGVLAVQLLVRFIKQLVGQLRPKGQVRTDYQSGIGMLGMPSGRSALMMFIATYFAIGNNNYKTVLLIYLIAATSIIIKYFVNEHNISQLVIGGILGTIVAFVFKKYRFLFNFFKN